MEFLLFASVVAAELLLLLVALFLCLFMLTWVISAYMDVPFVPTPNSVFPKIVGALDFVPGDVVYELGSGDGRFLLACARNEPRVAFIGIERNPFLHTYAQVRKHFRGNPRNLTFRRANFFDTDLSDATKIYGYLFTGVMDALLPKCERELTKARFASRAFQFSKKTPTEVVRLSEKPGWHDQHLLYVYDF